MSQSKKSHRQQKDIDKSVDETYYCVIDNKPTTQEEKHMGKKKHKKSDKNRRLETIVLITALLNLIDKLLDIIQSLLD